MPKDVEQIAFVYTRYHILSLKEISTIDGGGSVPGSEVEQQPHSLTLPDIVTGKLIPRVPFTMTSSIGFLYHVQWNLVNTNHS